MTGKRTISLALRRKVQERAGGRCEYCLVHNDDMLFAFEADHVIAEQHHGETVLENLAWACPMCNRYKGTNISSIDPATNEIVPLFNPRK
jgi:5-methylcytosine-specific restriction endonuclease McrA